MMSCLSTFSLLATTVLAAYSVVDDYSPDGFASKFNFFTGNDPTNGYVNYVDYNTAQSSGLYNVSNNQVHIGVDSTNTATGRGRNSVRIESKKSYQHGLIILDLAHMPSNACGTWPAFWLLSTSATWPNGGEIDIIEGVNSQNYNSMAVHTDAGCSISNTGGMSGLLETSDCNIAAANQATNQGCAIKTGNTNSYGSGFNSVGGGVYATEWTSEGISIWFFPRSAIPGDLSAGKPDPTGWGLPMAKFAGACDWDEKVVNQQIIFDITFCGDWAGNTFTSDTTCSSKANTCQAFVQNNPRAFTESYWSINSLKVYQQNGQALPSVTSTRSVTSTTTSVPTTSATPSTLSTIVLTTTSFTSTTTFSAPPTTFPTTSSMYITPTNAPPTVTTSSSSFASATVSSPIHTSPTSETNTWFAWAPKPTGDNGGHPHWDSWAPGGQRWGPPRD